MPISMPSTIVCIECGVTYFFTPQEKVSFERLLNTEPDFKMPRRCAECRKLRREEKIRMERQAITKEIPTYAPTLADMPRANEAVTPPTEEPQEVRFILATKDFEDLVHGRPIVWQGVRVILADIGFKVMREAIERAEMERARNSVRGNGH